MISIIKSVSCRSCGNNITILNVGKDPALSLCAICKPWVTNSLDYSPHKIAGVTIDDLELFMKYRTITKGFNYLVMIILGICSSVRFLRLMVIMTY